MKKSKLLLSLTVAASLILAACSGGGSESSSGDAKNEKKEIVLWSGTTGPDGDLIKKDIDRYNATNPDYKVKIVAMEGVVLGNKLATVTRSGKGVPDIALIASEAVSTYHSQGMLEPWDEYIEGTEVKGENYLEEAWKVGTQEGKQFGVPATMGSWVMYYNKDLVDKYVPGAADDNIITYEEIEKAGEAAKADGIYAYGFTWGMQNFNNLYLQMGGKFSDGEKPTIDNDTAVKTIEQFKKLHDLGYMNKKGEDMNKLFNNGKVIFLPEGTWMLSQMEKITSFKWAQTFTPQWDANNIIQGSGADQFAMFVSKERSEEKIKSIVKFLEWLQGNTTEWIKSGANPTALGMLDNQEYTDMPQSFLLKTDEARQAVTIITDPGSSYVFGEIDTGIWDMIQGKADIKEQLKKIQQTVNDKMAQ
ncbi:ABC transporter substrate-binding protein [Bacillus sp. FJAT-27225]|uniref:ABC transporter substrate-binding protein n=1 Tax=Bacillus sp. FJAT-27225 TaxID=1743144 RepID=UPI00080C241C|nr:extracellular solute-binding protein [Bacillus sp. FJAT-27225]OCA87649.1 ABC transporter substrate-binding protein [Bacillus sp. FJAT-27225]